MRSPEVRLALLSLLVLLLSVAAARREPVVREADGTERIRRRLATTSHNAYPQAERHRRN